MPTHPAITRQQSRIASSGEKITAPAPVYYSRNAALTGTSVYGDQGRALIIHVEAAAGNNNGVDQIVTQDPAVIAACDGAVKEQGFLTKIGALI